MLDTQGEPIVSEVIAGTPQAVSATLAELQDKLAQMPVAPSCRDDLMIVLGEVLNNIVEHAYAAMDEGPIQLQAVRAKNAVHVYAADRGRPMQMSVLMGADLPATGATEDLAEGGFGWFIIHSLAQDMTYERVAGENRLAFSIPA